MDGLRVPATAVDADGVPWSVRRAWPERDGTVTCEAVRPGCEHVRGGRVVVGDDGARVVLGPVGADARLPALARTTGRVVVHRPGRRAVVAGDGVHTKIVRPGRAAAVAAAAAGVDGGWPGGFATAPVVAGTDDAVVLGTLPGRSLRVWGAAPDDRWRSAWAEFAARWSAVAAVDPGPSVPDHGPEREAAVLRTWARVAAPLADDPAGVLAGTENVVATLLAGDDGRRALCHRDLHDGQLLWAPGEPPGLLDLDTVARAEPALDLGNLLAHVAWRVVQGGLAVDRAVEIRAMLSETARDAGVAPARLRVAEEAARWRIACVHLFRPPWRECAQRWLRGTLPPAERAPAVVGTTGRVPGTGGDGAARIG